jgi:hypothetical protein
MKKLVAVFVAFCFVFAFVNVVLAKNRKVEGTVEKIDGPFVIIKDAKGKMHKLHTDGTTKKTGEIKEGAEVEAVATGKGHAMSIMVKGGMGMKEEMKGGEMKGGDMKGQ